MDTYLYYKGTINGNNHTISGIIGYAHDNSISLSGNYGAVSENAYVGGLIGNSLKNTDIGVCFNDDRQ